MNVLSIDNAKGFAVLVCLPKEFVDIVDIVTDNAPVRHSALSWDRSQIPTLGHKVLFVEGVPHDNDCAAPHVAGNNHFANHAKDVGRI